MIQTATQHDLHTAGNLHKSGTVDESCIKVTSGPLTWLSRCPVDFYQQALQYLLSMKRSTLPTGKPQSCKLEKVVQCLDELETTHYASFYKQALLQLCSTKRSRKPSSSIQICSSIKATKCPSAPASISSGMTIEEIKLDDQATELFLNESTYGPKIVDVYSVKADYIERISEINCKEDQSLPESTTTASMNENLYDKISGTVIPVVNVDLENDILCKNIKMNYVKEGAKNVNVNKGGEETIFAIEDGAKINMKNETVCDDINNLEVGDKRHKYSFQCLACYKIFQSLTDFEVHTDCHASVCNVCDNSFNSCIDLLHHFNKLHLCNGLFSTPDITAMVFQDKLICGTCCSVFV